MTRILSTVDANLVSGGGNIRGNIRGQAPNETSFLPRFCHVSATYPPRSRRKPPAMRRPADVANRASAYAAGMAFGQRQNSRKLAPHISPNKSWAGAIGSVVFTLAAGACLYLLGFFPIKLWQWLIAAFIVVVFGIFGDLFESLVKRHYGVKDSGNIIAGHGGMWDRFDGALFAIPAVTVFFILTSII